MADTVREQVEAGIDVVSDGEMGKVTWSSYVGGRLEGCEDSPMPSGKSPGVGRGERDRFPRFFAEFIDRRDYYYKSPGVVLGNVRLVCRGPIRYVAQAAVQQDIAHLKAALEHMEVEEALFRGPTGIEYCQRILSNGRGIPSGLRGRDARGVSRHFRKRVAEHVEILNYALRGIQQDRVRLHVC